MSGTKSKIIEKAEIKRLKHTFSDEEKKVFADEMADALGVKSALEDEKKSVTSQIGSRITEQDAIINERGEKIRSGYEYRPTDCVVSYDFHNGHVTILRKDLDVIAESREMRPDERQMEFLKAEE